VESALEQQSSRKNCSGSAAICIVGLGALHDLLASHVGRWKSTVRTRDLASYFFSAIGYSFSLYAQYRVVPRFIHRDLDRRVGLWHAFRQHSGF